MPFCSNFQIESDFMTEHETDLVKGLMMDIIQQLEKDPTKLPVVYMFPQLQQQQQQQHQQQEDLPPSPTQAPLQTDAFSHHQQELPVAQQNVANDVSANNLPHPSAAAAGLEKPSRFSIQRLTEAADSAAAAAGSAAPPSHSSEVAPGAAPEDTDERQIPSSTAHVSDQGKSKPDSVSATPKDR